MGLISTMRRGSKIEQLNPIWRPTGPAFRAEARSAEAEMAAAADWARQQLASGVNRLAIISTSAGNIRGELGRTLDQCIGADQYSFSLGLPLAQYPLVKTALLLLRWSVEALSLTEASWLLLSPFFGGEVGPGELSTRARFDAHALRRGDIVQPQLSLTQFVRQMFRAISRSPAEWRALSSLLRSCEQALRFMQDANPRTRERNAYEWSEYFQRLLGIFQFPGKPSRDSKEFQTFKRWQQLLDQFAALAFDGSRMNATRAVQTLERLAGESIFQPETHEAPVQVMGPLEAAGSLFDGLWFLGANEMAWPLSGRPHPLLPWQLQREAAMLHSSPAADFAWSEQMTERLMKSAPNAVFSSAEQYGSEFARPSPLIEKFDRLVRGTRPGPQLVPAPQESKCKSFPDQPPLTWVKTRGSLYSSALRAQAACPFQAFATVRLECGLLDTPDDGLDAKQRGSLLHKLMQSVWTSPVEPDGLQNSQSLKQHLCDNTLRAFVSLHAEKIIKTSSPDPWEQQFFAVERERLTRLVCDWLQEVESRRPDFVVHETEKRFEDLEVGEAAFTVKIDRIDRLIADPVPQTDQREELILLDYKTGKTSCSTLSGERPEEPQLPLYATYALAEEPLVAVAFAQMRVDGMKFNGVSKREGILPNVGRGNETWASEMIGWREAVSNLTTDFVQGESRVDPSQGDQTCRLCDCGPLCRIAEIRKEAPREDDFD
jgi:probable DNA repair protein